MMRMMAIPAMRRVVRTTERMTGMTHAGVDEGSGAVKGYSQSVFVC